MAEKVANKDQHVLAANEYYPARIVHRTGKTQDALFTIDQLQVAVLRAEVNPEDVPPVTFMERLFG
jgi:hypothetical protein